MASRSSTAVYHDDASIEVYPERANLFSLSIQPVPAELYSVRRQIGKKTREDLWLAPTQGAAVVDATPRQLRRAIQASVLRAVSASGLHLGKGMRPVIVDKNSNLATIDDLRIYPAYEWQVIEFAARYFLCLDYRLRVHANLSLTRLSARVNGFLPHHEQRVLVRGQNGWEEATFVEMRAHECELALTSGERLVASATDVFPDLTRSQIVQLAPVLGVQADQLERTIKQLSLLTIANASRARLDICVEFAERLAMDIFPIKEGPVSITLRPTPATLRPPVFFLAKGLAEPPAAFDRVDLAKRAQDIFDGLTTFGAYDTPKPPLSLVLISTPERADGMARLIDRMNTGSFRYGGAQRTFGGHFVAAKHLISPNVDQYEERIGDFVQGVSIEQFDAALVYLPKSGDPNNPRHPYFRTKALLLREGLASQMVDEATVRNPDWRDLNLALNVYAKAGYAPWVLDEAMPGVDMIIGLSSSSVRSGRAVDRNMAYANVFDAYGRWRFYRGDTVAFPFTDRLGHFERLVRDAVAAYRAENSGPLRSVHFHLTKQPSAEERHILVTAVRSVAPEAIVTFVWINPHHLLRLYDLSESSGEIGRATYLLNEPGRIYLTTTGRNEFGQKGMGTPVPLQLTVWTDPLDARPPLAQVAQQTLSLTRLNWASSRNFCHEPITTKFAGDIAKLMGIFARDPRFSIHPRLRRVPWFL